MTDARHRPDVSLLVVFAVILEALAVVWAVSPYGSLVAPGGAGDGVARAAVVLAVALAVTALLRAVLPGPKTPALFRRPAGPSFARALYYALLASVLLAFWRAALVLAVDFTGTSLFSALPRELVARGPLVIFAGIIAATAAAYLFFGYLQGAAGGALGARAGLLAAASFAAVNVVWPLGGPSSRVGVYGPWLVFAVWRLPEALALAYLGHRTRTVASPVAAAFLVEWIAAVGTGVYAFFGRWPYLFASLVLALAAAEIAVAERRRLGRAVAGFFGLLFGRAAGASLLDGILVAAALAGGYYLARGADVIYQRRLAAVAVVALSFAGATALWITWAVRRRKRPAPAGAGGGAPPDAGG